MTVEATVRVASAEVGGFPDRESALTAIQASVYRAAEANADIVCFPQFSTLPYFPVGPKTRDHYELSERGEAQSLDAFRAAAMTHSIWLCGSYYETLAEGVFYCRGLIISPEGSIDHSYRQVHIDNRRGRLEAFYLQPGRRGLQTVDLPFGRVGLLLGSDARVPEAWRVLGLKGVEIVLFGLAETKEDLEDVYPQVRAGAGANGFYAISANRIGTEYGKVWGGGSRAFGPSGKDIEPAIEREGVRIFELDVEQVRSARRTAGLVTLRRPEHYTEVTDV